MTINKIITKKYLNLSVRYENLLTELDPKMLPFLLNKKKKGLFIFNLLKISKFLKLAGNLLQKHAEKGHKFLFIGTDQKISSLLITESLVTKNYYINSRWLGGMLTNWKILQNRIKRLNFLEKLNTKNLSFLMKKKKIATIKKETKKLNHLFMGIKKMRSFPQVIIFIDSLNNFSAIKECLKLGIPTITIIDSKVNPKLIQYPIISKKSSAPSVQFLVQYLNRKILTGYNNRRLKLYK